MIEIPYTFEFDILLNKSDSVNGWMKNLIDDLAQLSPQPVLNFKISYEAFSFYEDLYQKYKMFYPNAKLFISVSKITKDCFSVISGILKRRNDAVVLLNTDCINNNLRDTLSLLKLYGIEKITLYHSSGSDYSKESYEKFENDLNLCAKNPPLKELYLLPYLEKNERKNFYTNEKQNRRFLTCAAAWLNPIIRENGDLYCCVCSKIGNLKERSFFELWNNDKAEKQRTLLLSKKQIPVCNQCGYFYQKSFLVVENGIFEYQNKKFCFDSSINCLQSCPKLALIGKEKDKNFYEVHLMEIFDTQELQDLSTDDNLLFILQ